MTTNKELQQALNDLYERYGNTLKLLSDSLDQIDKLEKRKPKTITKEVQVETIVIKEIEKPIEVEKEIIRIVEKEVPGPERVVTKTNPVDGELKREIKQLNARIKELDNLKQTEVVVEVPVTEYVDSPPTVIEKEATGDLKQAARLLASSEMNKEDLSESQIYDMLQKSSEDEVKKKIGFWAQPLPIDTSIQETNKRYIGKK